MLRDAIGNLLPKTNDLSPYPQVEHSSCYVTTKLLVVRAGISSPFDNLFAAHTQRRWDRQMSTRTDGQQESGEETELVSVSSDLSVFPVPPMNVGRVEASSSTNRQKRSDTQT
ncbi:unnamed protein product [Protopolystoma xenopodis]|uniref:Uncharacterized protein n=1 Tax=Protopolystoma xenopodis TaxID=117903 RepID=A0A3S5AJC7_9PLAT|nr:unnamed protein product [Protopolystoma xenopodis]